MSATYETTGIVKAGKLQVRDRESFDKAVAGMKDGEVTVKIEQRADTRSARANNYYNGRVLKLMADATGHSRDELHADMCLRFLTQRLQYLNPSTGEVEERLVPGRSSKLKVSEFYDFVERVRLFAAEFLGLSIPDPDPLYQQDRNAARAA